MKYYLLFLILILMLPVFGQQHIPLRLNNEGFFYSADTSILLNEFREGRVAFMVKNKKPFEYKLNRVGFADSTGKVIVSPVYINCSSFENGQALVQDANLKFGVIDLLGRFVVPVVYDHISKCDNGLLFVQKNGKFGLLTKEGVELLPPKRYDGFAIPPPVLRLGNDMHVPLQFFWNELYFNASVRFKDFIGVRIDRQWGIINRNGNEIVAPKFDGIGIFNGEVAVAFKDKKGGVIDSAGNWLIPPIYKSLFITPYKAVVAVIDDKMGVLSLKNGVIIPIQYSQICQITPDAFLVTQEKEKLTGIINNKNKVIIPIASNRIEAFGSGFVVRYYGPTGNDYPKAALYNAFGKRISKYVGHDEVLSFPIWRLGSKSDTTINYIVYNRAKDKFVPYQNLLDVTASYGRGARRIAYQKGSKWGLLSNNGVEITKPVYNEVRIMELGQELFTIAKYNGYWGMVDSAGRTVINFSYDTYGKSGPGSFWFKKGELYKLVFKDLYSTDLKYDKIVDDMNQQAYGLNFIPVRANKKWGFLDKTGRELAPCIYDEFTYAVSFGSAQGNFMLPVRIGAKWGFLGPNLKQLVPIKYDAYSQIRYRYNYEPGIFLVTDNTKQGILDTAGKEMVRCIYDRIDMGQEKVIVVVKDKLYGLLHRNGSIFVDAKYQDITQLDQQFQSGHFWYQISDNHKKGLMDENGKVHIPCIYDELKLNRIGNISAKKDGKWGMITLDDKIIIPFLYEWVDEIQWTQNASEWVYRVKLNGKFGLVKQSGKTLIPYIYDYVDILSASYNHQHKALILVRNGSKSGILDWYGKTVAQMIFLQIYHYPNNYIVLGQDKKYGLLDLNGRQLLPPIYDYIVSELENHYFISKNKKLGVINYEGNFTIEPSFDKYNFFTGFHDFVPVIKDGKYGLLDCEGNVVYPCVYKSIKYEDGKIIVEKF